MKIERNSRVLCWDEASVSKKSNLTIKQHVPKKKEFAFLCDDAWEGKHNGYACVMKAGDKYRIYYRASAGTGAHADGTMTWGKSVLCVAESLDGIHFKKPNIGKFDYDGSVFNNIVFMRDGVLDNFSVFYDENPDCPKTEKFKALSALQNKDGVNELAYYASEDGYDFRLVRILPIEGAFDTYNVMVWDEARKKYFIFFRNYHTASGKACPFAKDNETANVRDVSVATSDDFVNWEAHGRLLYGEDDLDLQFYTNQIVKYNRANDMFVGFPMRYIDRFPDKRNLDLMPNGKLHQTWFEATGRGGTAMTDSAIIFSRDGKNFIRKNEAFLRPGPENQYNWWYGDTMIAYGLIETPAEISGAPNEISFFATENYRVKNSNFRRYTIRLDGFFSFNAPFAGGEFTTKPFTVNATRLKINFSTSALGSVIITLLDKDGKEIEGYKSYAMFGDSVDRLVEFEKNLSDLNGKTVQMKVQMSDADLYSFIFE